MLFLYPRVQGNIQSITWNKPQKNQNPAPLHAGTGTLLVTANHRKQLKNCFAQALNSLTFHMVGRKQKIHLNTE